MTSQYVVDLVKSKFSNWILNETVQVDQAVIEVEATELKNVLAFLKNHDECQFDMLVDLTAVDYLFPVKKTRILYFLHNLSRLDRICITVSMERKGTLPTVTDLWRGANWYERELFDMFGIQFESHPDLKRILMPDNWQGNPMLRDYGLTEEPVQFKHDVKPKVPSQTISYDKSKQRAS
jgi:NADH-quinone oxidoreductase subunit C